MFVVIIFFTLRILTVNCHLKIMDPIFPEYTKDDYNMTRMLTSASPYTIEEYCKPMRAWLLTRHGTKYPSEDVLNGISQKLIPVIQDLISNVYADESDYDFLNLEDHQKKIIKRLKKWKNVTASGSHKDLNNEGKLLMERLGKRWNKKLKELTKNLKLDEIEVLSAIEDRCVVSGKKFLRTFYEGDYDEINVHRALKSDTRLKLAKPAKSHVYVKDPENEKLVPVENIHFRNHSASIIERIQKLLFPNHVKKYQEYRDRITGEIVQIMYSACAHSFYYVDENVTKTDAWCDLFTFDDFKIFEEMDDLKYFYLNGYHYEYNPTMGDAITMDLQQFIENPNGLKFKLFIGHTSNLLSVITRFNLFRDEDKLTPDNIQNMRHRKWKSSFMTPLGCNIMVVVYDCGFEIPRVTLYLNESPITMVMNNGKTCTKCPMNDFHEMLDGFKMNRPSTPTNSRKVTDFEHDHDKAKELRKIQLDIERAREELRKIRQEAEILQNKQTRNEDKNSKAIGSPHKNQD